MQDNNHKNNGKKNKNKSYTVVITYFIIAFAFVMAFNVAKDKSTTKEITYNKFIEMLDNKEISKVVITSDNLLITPSEDNEEYIESSDDVFDEISEEKEESKMTEQESAFTKAEEPEQNSTDAVVTMDDFREAYRNIKNRYIYN